MIAHMFARAANIRILLESPEPRYPPLGDPKQNSEDDLDFTILTGQGDKLMELTEFAPLQQHGPKFKDAPQEAPLIWPTPEVLITSRFLSKRFDHRESRPTTPARHSVAPIIIPLGAAWPPVDGQSEKRVLLSKRGSCFYRTARICHRCRVLRGGDCHLERHVEAKQKRPADVTEAIRARSGSLAVKPGPMVRNLALT
jgi:hypothetical protein